MLLPRHMGFGDWRTATKITLLASKLGVDALHGPCRKGRSLWARCSAIYRGEHDLARGFPSSALARKARINLIL